MKIYYFGAAWCGQCKVLKPQFIAECNRLGLKENDDYVILDADDEPERVAKYGIRNLPTLVFERDGDVVGRSYGVTAWKDIAQYYG